MSQYFKIHPKNPQGRLIHQAAVIIEQGGVIAYPTNSGYALGCHLGDKKALDRIVRIRQLDTKHQFTLICSDIKQVSLYAHFDTPAYRLLKANTPGSYTFILPATREVPRRLLHPKKKTIGIRITDNIIARQLLTELGEPMMTATLIQPGETDPMEDPGEIREQFQYQLDLVIDGGACGNIPSTLIDLTDTKPVILREGKGDVTPFL